MAVKEKQKQKNYSNKRNFSKESQSEFKPQINTDAKKHFKWQVFFIAILAILLYSNTLGFDYNLDDGLMITENTFTKKGISGIKDILTNDSFVGFFGEAKNLVAGGRYRPLSQILFAIQWQFFGSNPFIGHLTNILLYAFLCVFIFLILRKLLRPKDTDIWYLSLPFVITVLFTAHPLHTEVVANIKGVDEIMSLLGSMSALYFTLKFLENKKVLNLIWAAICFFLALLSKENAITFLVIIPLTFYFFTKNTLKEILISISPLFLMAVLFIVVRTMVLGVTITNDIEKELLNNPFLGSSTMEKFATIFYTWLKYLGLLVFPHPLTHDYYPKQIPIINFADLRAIMPVIIFGAMGIWSLLNIKKKNIYAYAILFFLLSFSIVSNLVFPIGTFMNERFMFTSLLGFCIVVAYFFTVYLKTKIKDPTMFKNVVTGILVVFLVGYSLKTFTRNFVWINGYTLFTTDVKTSTNSAKCNVSAGELSIKEALKKENSPARKRELLLQAVEYLKVGVKIHPVYVGGWIMMGNAYLYLEQWENTIICYENVLKIAPLHKDALNNFLYAAQNATKQGYHTIAIKCYKSLIGFQPNNWDYYYQLAGVYEKQNKIDSIFSTLNYVIEKNPKYAPAYSKLGEIYGKHLNDLDKSISYLKTANELDPSDPSACENLGIAYGIKKDWGKSLFYFEKAYDLKPDSPQLLINIAGTYSNMGNKAKANELTLKAQELSKGTKNQ
ncbi:MAG: DUF1736 domain-containing protein [Bacteroidetes bacterium]|nr:DUF1736 domain-containing protein [Bacteroidota bacterium]